MKMDNGSKAINILSQLNTILSTYTWTVFGSVAIVLHNRGQMHRTDLGDIDIIIEGKEEEVIEKFNNIGIELKNKPRNGRRKCNTEIDGIKIELMFMIDENTIVLADGEYKFNNIVFKQIDGKLFPAIDLQSLHDSKVRHLKSIEKDLAQNHNIVFSEGKKIKILEDINTIESIKATPNESPS